jgi:arylsulfatase A-like enzyme
MLAGSVLGLFEAVLLYLSPRYSVVARPDSGPVIFLVAPLTDLVAFGLVGLALGYLAEKTRPAGRSYRELLLAAGLGVAGGFAGGVSFLQFWWGRYPSVLFLALVVIAVGMAVSVIAAAVLRKWGWRLPRFAPSQSGPWVRRLKVGAVALGIVLVGSVAVYEGRGFEDISDAPAPLADTAARPNIVLIALDTARADHLSCYGYSRATTPNIDGLAQRGVQFENAIAPSSWTLPSVASLFTGLFPHQHGADWSSPLPDRFPTLAMALKSAGYQTGGFNANYVYGQASQGMARGFDRYEDGAENLRQNFMRTMFGRTLVKFIYARIAQPDRPERQNAEEINRKVFRWFAHRRQRPYFLFISYFDLHHPYLAPGPYAKRFGELSYSLIRRMDGAMCRVEPSTLSPADYVSLVAGYDNVLAYTDSQIGALIQFLSKLPDWSNTVLIITADHGEAFGEHGLIGHGRDLSRELVHVPLIIFGPGIPAGLRVRSVVGTRRLHATILGLAMGSNRGWPGPSSLQNYWCGQRASVPTPIAVVSELTVPTQTPRLQNAYISLTTDQWHWILDAHGHSQLFDRVKDPQEKADLAGSPQTSAAMATLQRALRERLIASTGPWAGLPYLQPLGPISPPPLQPQERDLLDSLPYQ